MVNLVRVARVLFLLVLAYVTVVLVIAVGDGGTGLFEKAVLVALIVGCVFLAVRISSWATAAQHRLRTR
jgi:hypothetical protein